MRHKRHKPTLSRNSSDVDSEEEEAPSFNADSFLAELKQTFQEQQERRPTPVIAPLIKKNDLFVQIESALREMAKECRPMARNIPLTGPGCGDLITGATAFHIFEAVTRRYTFCKIQLAKWHQDGTSSYVIPKDVGPERGSYSLYVRPPQLTPSMMICLPFPNPSSPEHFKPVTLPELPTHTGFFNTNVYINRTRSQNQVYK